MSERIAFQKRARVVAVVLAGGTGTRVGLNVPKQLVKIAGKPIIEHTLSVFERSDEVDDILVFMHEDFILEVQDIVDRAGFSKVRGVHAGGQTRNATSQRAIDVLSDWLGDGEEVKVLLHDAVRPLLSHQVISDCVAALDQHGAVDVAIPASDTIVVVRDAADSTPYIDDIPERGQLRCGQTPQGFRFSVLRRAYELAALDQGFEATDDCSIVLRYLPSVPIGVVNGDECNMKVTYPVDLFVADKLFQLQAQLAPARSTPQAYTQQFEGRVMVVFGASYGIGQDIADTAQMHGCMVFRFSRSLTGTHVEDPEDVAAALRDVHAQTGRIDFVVNTAGVLPTGDLADTSLDAVHRTTAVNYLAPIYIAREAHSYLAATQGQLLLYTSSSYTRGRKRYSLYSSAKAATVNLTQALSEEWASTGVRVNCINPERTRTPMRLNAFGAEPEDSLLTSQDVAQASIDVLLSPMTGHVVDVRRQDPAQQNSQADGAIPFPEAAVLAGSGTRH